MLARGDGVVTLNWMLHNTDDRSSCKSYQKHLTTQHRVNKRHAGSVDNIRVKDASTSHHVEAKTGHTRILGQLQFVLTHSRLLEAFESEITQWSDLEM